MDIKEHIEYYQGDDYEIVYAVKLRRYESSMGFILKYWLLFKEKFKINIAFENRLYFIRNVYDIYGSYLQSENNYGLSTFLGFEIETPIDEKFSIIFMPLYRINEFYLRRNSNNNPSISLNKRVVYDFKNDFNPLKYNIRIRG